MDTSNLILIALEAFTSLFIALNPIGTVPVFAALTGGTSPEHKKTMARRATLIVLGILTVFGLTGFKTLELLGIDFYSFKVGGGILLMLLGIHFVYQKEDKDDTVNDAVDAEGMPVYKKNPDDISVFPVGVPMLAGSAVITTLVIQMERVSSSIAASATVLVTMWVVIILTYFMLRAAGFVSKLLGPTGVNIATRIVGILLTSMACEFMIEGLKESGLFAGTI